MFTLNQLENVGVLDDYIQDIIDQLDDFGFATDFDITSIEYSLIQMIAWSNYNRDLRISQASQNSFNQTASGSALTRLAYSVFDNERVQAEATTGYMIFTGSAGHVPRAFSAGELIVTDGIAEFTNDVGFTISDGTPYVTASVTCTTPGTIGNISSDTDLTFVGSFVGFSVTNPQNVSGISGSWITVLGVDEESDTTLKQRNQTKWSTLQPGTLTSDRVKFLAVSASSGITHVQVDDQNPRGQFTVDVYVAKALSTATSAQVTAIQSVLDTAFFGSQYNNLISASAAVELPFSRSISIYYDPAYDQTNINTAVTGAIDQWIERCPIGGFDLSDSVTNVANLPRLAGDIFDVDGVTSVVISSSNVEQSVADGEKLVQPTSGYPTILTYVAVT